MKKSNTVMQSIGTCCCAGVVFDVKRREAQLLLVACCVSAKLTQKPSLDCITSVLTVICAGGGNRVSSIALEIGRAIQAEVGIMKLKKENRHAWSKLQQKLRAPTQTLRRAARDALQTDGEWSTKTYVKVGSALIHIFLSTSKFKLPRESLESYLLWLEANPSTLPDHDLVRIKRKKAMMNAARALDNHPPAAPPSEPAEADPLSFLEEDSFLFDEAEQHRHNETAENFDEQVFNLEQVAAKHGIIISEEEESVEVPAFRHSYVYSSNRVHGVILIHPSLRDKLSAISLPYDVAHYPMIVPPQPWAGWKQGGYLKHKIPVSPTQFSFSVVLLTSSGAGYAYYRLIPTTRSSSAQPHATSV